METVARGATWSDVTVPIRDAVGAVVTDGLTGTPTVTLSVLRDAAGADRRTGASLSYDGDGGYRVTKPIPSDAALGSWWGVVTYNDGLGFSETYPFGFTVITAAQADPAGDIRTVWTNGRAAKLDRIGTAGVVLTAEDSPATEDITIRRGDANTVGSPRGPFLWSDDDWSSYGLTNEGVVVTWRLISAGTVAASKAVTVLDAISVRLELTDAETAALRWGVFAFTVTMVDGDDTATLVTGSATVL